MIKKLSLYIGFSFLSINIINGNLSSLYSYLKQRININTIVSEKIKICDPLQNNIEDNLSCLSLFWGGGSKYERYEIIMGNALLRCLNKFFLLS